MPQTISGAQIQQLYDSIFYSDASSKQNAIVNAYTFLYDRGYNYAGWAGGVAAQTTWTGIAAMDFLTNTALMGVGSQACQTLPASTVLNIKTGLALDYLNVLAGYAEKSAWFDHYRHYRTR